MAVVSKRPLNPLTLAAVALLVLYLGWQQWSTRQTPDSTTPAAETSPSPGSPAEPLGGRLPPSAREADRYDLSADEAKGGHTLARHVGRTDDQLRERLDCERNISAASTYTDRATAERIVFRTLADQAARVDAWRAREGRRPNLALDYRGRRDDIIGRTLTRGRGAPIASTEAVVVLRWDERRDAAYVLTSYPEARR